MRLYLSSAGVGNHLDKLLDMMGSGRRVLYVGNAEDDNLAYKKEHMAEKKRELEGYGLEFFELDLRNYFDPKKHEILRQIVDATDLLWLGGGNTFLLRRAMSYSGLDTIIHDSLRDDKFVYGGSSAGAIVATKTLHGSENGDNPYSVPEGYNEEIVWDGLGLVYLQLVPHYQTEWFGDHAQAMVDYFDHTGLKYETLRDGEVYMVDGEYEVKLT